jgi:hypothetical protein
MNEERPQTATEKQAARVWDEFSKRIAEQYRYPQLMPPWVCRARWEREDGKMWAERRVYLSAENQQHERNTEQARAKWQESDAGKTKVFGAALNAAARERWEARHGQRTARPDDPR